VTTARATTYIRLWQGIGPELGFILVTLPIVVISFIVLPIDISSGIGLAIVWLGIPIPALTVLTGRGCGWPESRRLKATGGPTIACPDCYARPIRQGMMGSLFSYLTARTMLGRRRLHRALSQHPRGQGKAGKPHPTR
jgi:hypothetical protein